MQVVGADKLAVFVRQGRAAGALRVFYALANQARWTGPDDLRRQFGAAVRFVDPGRVRLDLAEDGFRIDLQVNYALSLVRIDSVVALDDPRPQGAGETT